MIHIPCSQGRSRGRKASEHMPMYKWIIKQYTTVRLVLENLPPWVLVPTAPRIYPALSVTRYSTHNQPPPWSPRPCAVLRFIYRQVQMAKLHVNATRRNMK
ncbi:hypothetical protein EVAR_22658_1 [Eumeta japonica]|uniref:Uncharacterized protein n=1 Tax=Eumeta variegata TaxID=151549 RepID=A0A4C1VLG1_EUMVA|nr:hypothetical protein EVAR_22658_1 [Eumeta japonica]